MKRLNFSINRLKEIYTESISLSEPFIDFAARFANLPGTVLLMSGGNLDCARRHILGIKPWLSLSGRGRDLVVVKDNQTVHIKADPFDTIRYFIDALRPVKDMSDPALPISSGFLGYLAYDLKDQLEKLPRTSIDDRNLPDFSLYVPSILVVHDKADKSTRLIIAQRNASTPETLGQDLDFFHAHENKPFRASGTFSGRHQGFRSNFKRSDYMAQIRKIRDYITAGDVYQVNMSQRFEMNFSGDPFHLFKKLYRKNPTPFFSFINAGDHHIISTTPERFVLQMGRRVEARPIKGTRPRGKTDGEDTHYKNQLRRSKKDDAELSMIVDLLRNDLGKVCEADSVRVAQHKRLEAYENVYHLVSVVEGKLEKRCDGIDLIKATFPGGSITGCPKIRSMEIIDELEPNRRHIYTGVIGYISFNDTMDLSIAIRTATVHQGKITFSVGGGIVYDSDPADEYDETMHKGKTLMTVFKGHSQDESSQAFVWKNGAIVPAEQAVVPVSSIGFQYGYGFFETIRVDAGKIHHLDAHINRFNNTWKTLFPDAPPDLTWDHIISQVISANGFDHTTAAVKMMAAMGDINRTPVDYHLIVTARKYTHRLEGKKEKGLHLAIYPNPRQTPLADHKTLNYMYYFAAGMWAKDQGVHEALILNPDGSISETHTANILVIEDNTVILPTSLHVLPGIMLQKVCDELQKRGYDIKKTSVRPDNLSLSSQVILTNSLMGAVPVLTIQGKNINQPSNLCDKINKSLSYNP